MNIYIAGSAVKTVCHKTAALLPVAGIRRIPDCRV